jgi:hypothetical protein
MEKERKKKKNCPTVFLKRSFPKNVRDQKLGVLTVHQTHWLLRLVAGIGSLTIGRGTATTSVTSLADDSRL